MKRRSVDASRCIREWTAPVMSIRHGADPAGAIFFCPDRKEPTDGKASDL